jgi:hypothetical protein
MSKRALLGTVIVLAFVAYIVWSTFASQAAECRVCVAFRGGQNCATASAATKKDASRNAQTTACGPLAPGMNDAIACSNAVPISAECKTR